MLSLALFAASSHRGPARRSRPRSPSTVASCSPRGATSSRETTQPATAEAFFEADLGAKVSGHVSELKRRHRHARQGWPDTRADLGAGADPGAQCRGGRRRGAALGATTAPPSSRSTTRSRSARSPRRRTGSTPRSRARAKPTPRSSTPRSWRRSTASSRSRTIDPGDMVYQASSPKGKSEPLLRVAKVDVIRVKTYVPGARLDVGRRRRRRDRDVRRAAWAGVHGAGRARRPACSIPRRARCSSRSICRTATALIRPGSTAKRASCSSGARTRSRCRPAPCASATAARTCSFCRRRHRAPQERRHRPRRRAVDRDHERPRRERPSRRACAADRPLRRRAGPRAGAVMRDAANSVERGARASRRTSCCSHSRSARLELAARRRRGDAPRSISARRSGSPTNATSTSRSTTSASQPPRLRSRKPVCSRCRRFASAATTTGTTAPSRKRAASIDDVDRVSQFTGVGAAVGVDVAAAIFEPLAARQNLDAVRASADVNRHRVLVDVATALPAAPAGPRRRARRRRGARARQRSRRAHEQLRAAPAKACVADAEMAAVQPLALAAAPARGTRERRSRHGDRRSPAASRRAA